MDRIVEQLNRVRIANHAKDLKQQQKVDKLRYKLRKQAQVLLDYQLLVQKLETQNKKKHAMLMRSMDALNTKYKSSIISFGVTNIVN